MKTSEVLNRAADHIQAFGHHKGAYSPGGPWDVVGQPMCVLGAMNLAAGELVAPSVTVPLMNHVGTEVTGWNDAPGRTAAEVIEVLRAVAVIEAARESAPAGVSA